MTPRTVSTMPNTRNQTQDLLTCSSPARKKSVPVFIVFSPFGAPPSRLTSGSLKPLNYSCAPTSQLRFPPRKGTVHSSSRVLIVVRDFSSDDLVLSTATFLTMLPFGPVSPACSDPFRV